MEGGAGEERGGGGSALQVSPCSMPGARDDSGTAGTVPGNQQQWGQDHTTLTVCTKGLTQEAGKHSQHSPTGIMAEAAPSMQGTVGENKLVMTAIQSKGPV